MQINIIARTASLIALVVAGVTQTNIQAQQALLPRLMLDRQ